MKKFLWGSATASYQCEGAWNEEGRVESMWDTYLHENNLENGDTASDHYHRYEEDIKMIKEGGQNAYRFSIAWPRIISDINGTINQKGLDFYRRIIECCLTYDIEPFITLYHWDLPTYLEELGGWQNQLTIEKYIEYISVVFKEFNGLVNHWVTFNEPRWFIFNGYLIGNYPPGLNNPQCTIKGAYYVMLANAYAINKFRELNISGEIGIVHSYTPVDGIDDSLSCKIAMRYADNYCNNWVLDTAIHGEIPIDLLADLYNRGYDLSFIKPLDLQVIKNNTVDFIGVNYYARMLVKPYRNGETTLIVNNSGMKAKGTTKTILKGWFEAVKDPNSMYTEWDTEIYPKGLYDGLMRAYDKYNIPIYITENGLGYYEDVSVSSVNDEYRIAYMKDHINALLNAKEDGADIRGYFAWSSFDLYSWKNGVEKRYGLVAVDFNNQSIRKPKKSYYWYKEVINNNARMIFNKIYKEENIGK